MAEPDRARGRRREQLDRTVRRKAERHRRARSERHRTAWFGLGMFGLIGWSVAVPTLAGIAFGWWLDQRLGGTVSWTLTFLFIGVIVGCLNAWYWIQQESDRRD